MPTALARCQPLITIQIPPEQDQCGKPRGRGSELELQQLRPNAHWLSCSSRGLV